MSKEITFMRKDLFTSQAMDEAIQFLTPLFANDSEIFKEMIASGQARLEGKSFTYIDDTKNKKSYRIMGNCIGPVIYIRDIFDLENN